MKIFSTMSSPAYRKKLGLFVEEKMILSWQRRTINLDEKSQKDYTKK